MGHEMVPWPGVEPIVIKPWPFNGNQATRLEPFSYRKCTFKRHGPCPWIIGTGEEVAGKRSCLKHGSEMLGRGWTEKIENSPTTLWKLLLFGHCLAIYI